MEGDQGGGRGHLQRVIRGGRGSCIEGDQGGGGHL